jgi:4-methyl-5(b-hydroxyethyl)-thiazole monophosphate biosynthesis
MPKSALVILTDNFEEIEAVSPIDLLRRAEVELTVASRTGFLAVRGRSGITLTAECLLETAQQKNYDLVVLPGGPGTPALRGDERVVSLIKRHVARGGLVGAICAAPTVLKEAGVIKGVRITGHDSVMQELPQILDKEKVVVDGQIITSRGAGTAVEFSLALVEKLCGYDKALKIAHAICTGV